MNKLTALLIEQHEDQKLSKGFKIQNYDIGLVQFDAETLDKSESGSEFRGKTLENYNAVQCMLIRLYAKMTYQNEEQAALEWCNCGLAAEFSCMVARNESNLLNLILSDENPQDQMLKIYGQNQLIFEQLICRMSSIKNFGKIINFTGINQSPELKSDGVFDLDENVQKVVHGLQHNNYPLNRPGIESRAKQLAALAVQTCKVQNASRVLIDPPPYMCAIIERELRYNNITPVYLFEYCSTYNPGVKTVGIVDLVF